MATWSHTSQLTKAIKSKKTPIYEKFSDVTHHEILTHLPVGWMNSPECKRFWKKLVRRMRSLKPIVEISEDATAFLVSFPVDGRGMQLPIKTEPAIFLVGTTALSPAHYAHLYTETYHNPISVLIREFVDVIPFGKDIWEIGWQDRVLKSKEWENICLEALSQFNLMHARGDVKKAAEARFRSHGVPLLSKHVKQALKYLTLKEIHIIVDETIVRDVMTV
jgi:hypothetical protein